MQSSPCRLQLAGDRDSRGRPLGSLLEEGLLELSLGSPQSILIELYIVLLGKTCSHEGAEDAGCLTRAVSSHRRSMFLRREKIL